MIGIRSSRVSAERSDLALDAEALAALGARTGDIVEVRAAHVVPRRAERSREEHDNHNQQRRRRT